MLFSIPVAAAQSVAAGYQFATITSGRAVFTDFCMIVLVVRLLGIRDMFLMKVRVVEVNFVQANKITATNAGWRTQFRCRGSRRESAVAQLSTLGVSSAA